MRLNINRFKLILIIFVVLMTTSNLNAFDFSDLQQEKNKLKQSIDEVNFDLSNKNDLYEKRHECARVTKTLKKIKKKSKRSYRQFLKKIKNVENTSEKRSLRKVVMAEKRFFLSELKKTMKIVKVACESIALGGQDGSDNLEAKRDSGGMGDGPTEQMCASDPGMPGCVVDDEPPLL